MVQVDDEYVEALAREQVELFEHHPDELISRINEERAILDSYRGRQILELIQNADDACENYDGARKFLLRLTPHYLFAANTGIPFSPDGIKSLVISHNSPKPAGGQFIGNKGLGFRSLLSWSRSLVVLSGAYCFAFSQRHADEQIGALTGRVQALIERERRKRSILHAPVLRFPFLPEATPVLCEARAILAEGYDTVIALELSDSQGREVRQDISEQARKISGETVIFCHHLEEIAIEISHKVVHSVKRTGSRPQIVELNPGAQDARTWHLYRETGEVPSEFIDEGSEDCRNYEIAVAIAEGASETSTNHNLCVYFPTNDELPMAMLAHATLETTQNRKNINPHAANRYVLAELAKLIVDLAERQCGTDSFRGLRLLAGIEKCATELQELDFLHSVFAEARSADLFPTLGHGNTTADIARWSPDPVWDQVATAQHFPELLESCGSPAVQALLRELQLQWYEPSELARRLEELIKSMAPQEAGIAVGRLIRAGSIPSSPRPSLLMCSDGIVAGSQEPCFLPSERRAISLPAWVTGFKFLDSDFVEGIRSILAVTTVRDTRYQLVSSGYEVLEFQSDNVARRLVAEASREEATKAPDHKVSIWRDVLSCLYSISPTDQPFQKLSASVCVITTKGSVRQAEQCFMGPEYPRGRELFRLYGSLGEDEFTADPGTLGLSGEIATVERFLESMGVKTAASIDQATPQNLGYDIFIDVLDNALRRLAYPNNRFGRRVNDVAEARSVFSYFSGFENVPLLERLPNLIEKGDSASLASYLAKNAKHLVEREEYSEANLLAFRSREQYPRPYALTVPNVVLHLLRTKSWIPCEDGRRHRADEVMLSSRIHAALDGLFFRHRLFQDPITKNKQEVREVESFLSLLGSPRSLEDLDSKKVYSILSEHPLRDPFGETSAGLYRQLLETASVSPDDPWRNEFVEHGKLLGLQDGKLDYFAVSELRYSSSPSLPRVVAEKIKRFVLEQGDGERIERLFGVEPLSRKEYEVVIDPKGLTTAPSTSEVQDRWRVALPYICAWRLSTSIPKTLRRLKLASIDVCTRAVASVRIQGLDPEQVVLSLEGEGLVARDGQIVLVWSEPDAAGDPVFWRTVGDLCAELLEMQVAADLSAFLMCESATNMERMLVRLVGQNGHEALQRAYEFLGTDREGDEEDVSEQYTDFVPPRPESAEPEQLEEHEQQTGANVPPLAATYNITPAPAPERKTSPPRSLVVTRAFTSSPSSLRGRHLVSEEDAWRVIEAFEGKEKRFPLPVAHLRGTRAFGCDVISFSSERARTESVETGKVNARNVKRYIEMKCRSNRTGSVQLSDNEMTAAKKRARRYYIYRIYRDTHDYRRLELAILQNPVNSSGRRRKEIIDFDLCAGSGADWFELSAQEPDTEPSAEGEDE